MNPAYNTCTVNEAVHMANNAGMESAQLSRAINHDAPDDNMFDNDKIRDGNLAPEVSEHGVDNSNDDHAI